jgi:hypothetical protein
MLNLGNLFTHLIYIDENIVKIGSVSLDEKILDKKSFFLFTGSYAYGKIISGRYTDHTFKEPFTMSQDQSKILDKLGKIKAHQESAAAMGSEAEAQHFARMLNDLLIKHKLEMTDIQYEAEVKDEPVDRYPVGGQTEYVDGKRRFKEYPDVEIKSRRVEWAENLAAVIAQANSVGLLVIPGSSRLIFVGKKSNCAVAEYLFITMLRAAESISKKEYKRFRSKQRRTGGDLRDTHNYRESWLEGFVNRLSNVFYEQKQKQEESQESSTALIRMDKDMMAVDKWKKENIKKTAKSLGGGRGFNEKGYQDGKNFADTVDLNRRGMGTSSTKKLS